MKKINFKEKFQKFSDQWSPKVIAEMNDYQFKLVKIQNDFIWHKHKETDEVFIVLNGKIFIEFEDETILSFYNFNIVDKNIDKNSISKIFKKFKM